MAGVQGLVFITDGSDKTRLASGTQLSLIEIARRC